MSRTLSRRTFVYGLVIGSASSSLITYELMRPAETKVPEKTLLDFINNESSISAEVGKLYLAEKNQMVVNIKELEKSLISGPSIGKSSIRSQLSARIENDFKEGKLCQINGWTLSETECQLSALAYLVRGEKINPSASIPSSESNSITDSEFVTFEGWGPQTGQAGMPFNEQPNGNSALWLKVIGLMRENQYQLYFDQTPMITTVHFEKNLITADLLPKESIRATAEGGKKAIYLLDQTNKKRQLVGYYKIAGKYSLAEESQPNLKLADLKSESLVSIDRWGPHASKRGESFNQQPNGNSAFWLKIDERSGQRYALFFGDEVMKTSFYADDNLITASISPGTLKKASANKSKIKMHLVDVDKKAKQLIGYFELQ